MAIATPLMLSAEDLEPRRWAHIPTGLDIIGAGYAYTTADILFDPALRIENVEMTMQTWAIKYIHTFAVMDKSARIELGQAYQKGHWEGLVQGQYTTVNRSGLADTNMRFAVNLYGAPPLRGKEYAVYQAQPGFETIIGAALIVQFPTGEYMSDKVINIGSNRYTFRPQLGALHKWDSLSFEYTGSVWIYTDNTNFNHGNTLKQDPTYTGQTHLVYVIQPGIWVGASAAYEFGSETTVSGRNMNDHKENAYWSLGVGFPILKPLIGKVAYVGSHALENTGFNSESVTASISLSW